jgi:signal transduction histidine kinase
MVCDHPLLKAVLDAFSGLVLVLNRERQVVGVNDAVLGRLGFEAEERALGLRPGELLDCVHADTQADGCGTSKRCAHCGTTVAILSSQRQAQQVGADCRLSIRRNGIVDALELEVLATPFDLDGEQLTLLSLRDISDRKRLEMLERTFFHDVLNTLSGIRGWNELLIESHDVELADTARRVHRLVNRLAQQVDYQRAIWRAASGELEPELAAVSIFELVEDLRSFFLEHPTAAEKRLDLPELSADAELVTDRALLLRVLANMLTNAFEATDRGGRVALSWSSANGEVAFDVWNGAVMSEEVALNVFTRSFSTKGGSGRGLGTYAMKLFGEQFLGGQVGFTSTAGKGTTFRITLPVAGPIKQ